MNLLRKFASFFRREKLDTEMAEELRAHVELQTRENIARGMPPGEARGAAVRSLGGEEQIKERCRDERRRGLRWFDDLVQDVRYGLRVLRRSPIVSAVIVLSLALGLGANTAVFSWIRTVAFEPFGGVRAGNDLVIIEQRTGSGIVQFASPAEWRDVRARSTSFRDLFAHNISTFVIEGGSQDVRIWGEFVTGNFFDVLGAQPASGRLLRLEDDVPGAPLVAVISHRLWQTELGGRADAIGRSLQLNNRSYTIVGIAAPEFQGAVAALGMDVWLPQASFWNQESRSGRMFQLMGRLRPGVTLRQANAEIALQFQRLAADFPESNRGVSADVIPHWRSRIGAQSVIVPTLATLQTVMALLLLIVCANTANLLLAQSATRRKEIAIRLSLGAGRARVVRQLLAEGMLLAFTGAALGTLVAFWGLDLINRIPKPAGMPITISAHLDVAELIVSVLLAMMCAMAFALVPALQATRTDVSVSLKAGGRTSHAGGRRRLQEVLVGAEIALTLVVVILAGLFLKSFNNARTLNPGFESRGVMLAEFDLAARGYDQNRARLFSSKLLARVREVSGIEAAALTTWVPLDIIFSQPAEFALEGRPRHPTTPEQTLWYEASRGYFDTLRIGMVEGRDFSDAAEGREPEAVVNAEFVRRYLPAGKSALGRRLSLHGIDYRIVGVVRGSKYNSLNETPQPMAYLSFSGRWRTRVRLFARTTAEPEAAFAALRKVMREIDAGVALLETRTLVQHLDDRMILRKIPAKLLAILGPLALALAMIGLYSVRAYSVAQRTHEIGVRVTLGASTRAVVLLIMRQGMAPVVVGMTIGLVAAYAVSVRLARQLVGVPAGDLVLFTTLPLLLGIVALVACWLPARRAARMDPMAALRAE